MKQKDWITQRKKYHANIKEAYTPSRRTKMFPKQTKYYVKYCRFKAKFSNKITTTWTIIRSETGQFRPTVQIPS